MQPAEERHTSETQPIRVQNLSARNAMATANLESESEPSSAGRFRPEGEGVGDQDRIRTPSPLQPLVNGGSRGPVRSRASCALWAVLGFCVAVSIASLVLNVVLITNLLAVRQTFAGGVDQAIAGLENLESTGFRYEFHLQQTIPFSGDIPFQQDMVFPFTGTVPINTTVRVPIDAGILGQFTLDVPIDTSIPVDVQVPVQISQTFHVDTEIPIDMMVPIEISPHDPAIETLIDGVRDWLIALREML
jgi:hypothetical protein